MPEKDDPGQVGDDDGESMLELFGALTTCLARAIALANADQLDRYENEVLTLLATVNPESVAAGAFRSVLREIETCRVRAAPH